MIPKPVQDFITTPQRDILNENLSRAKEQTHPSDLASMASVPGEQKDEETFINPFISQIPQEIKTDLVQNTQQQFVTPGVIPEALTTPQFNVSGIVWRSKNLQAIINGEIVTIGDRVNNWVVSEITKDGVHMTFEQQSLWVKPMINPEGETQAQPTNPYRR